MEFFEEAFHWLAGVSEKLPVVDIKMFFIVVLSVISGIGVITAFTLLGSHARKLYVSSKKSENTLPTSMPLTTTTSAISRRIVSPKRRRNNFATHGCNISECVSDTPAI